MLALQKMSGKFLSSYISWLGGHSYPEENFVSEYLYGDRENAVEYICILNPDYDKGYLLVVVVREGDVESLGKLLEKRPKEKFLTSALCTAAMCEDKECAKLLMKHGANSEGFRGTTVWKFLEGLRSE